MSRYSFSAPAKVNLALRVVGKRTDGYHLLQTVMVFFPLFDTVTIEVGSLLHLTCSPAVTTAPEENLVFRAAEALRKAAGVRHGAVIHLNKEIPTGAGLGGGSSDAATTLLALNRLWGLNGSLAELIALGVTLGADIPFFLGQSAALAEGIGEQLTPLPDLPQVALVLIYPGVSLATAKVYGNLTYGAWHHPEPLIIPSGDQSVVNLLENDLEPVAKKLAPVITTMGTALMAMGAQGTLMSGSGSALFGLFPTEQSARCAQEGLLRQHHPGWQMIYGQTFNRHPFTKEWDSGISDA